MGKGHEQADDQKNKEKQTTSIREKPSNFTYNIKNVNENKEIVFIRLAKN